MLNASHWEDYSPQKVVYGWIEERIHEIVQEVFSNPEPSLPDQEIKKKRTEGYLLSLAETLIKYGSIAPHIAKRLDKKITDHSRFQEMFLEIILISAKETWRIEDILLAILEYKEVFQIEEAIRTNAVLQELLEKRMNVMSEHGQELVSVLKRFVAKTEAALSFSG